MSAEELTPIEITLRRSASALQKAAVPFVLGGSLACWARGGPRPHNDVDLIVAPEDAEAALAALLAVDMREERPPEDWLVKAHDDEVCVDIIFDLAGVEVDRDYVAQAEVLSVLAIHMPVMSVEDVLVSRLLSIDEHRIDYTAPVAIARALREQVNWHAFASRVSDSPYARGFLALVAALGIADLAEGGVHGTDAVKIHRIRIS